MLFCDFTSGDGFAGTKPNFPKNSSLFLAHSGANISLAMWLRAGYLTVCQN
jgi:hypothetical protein